MNKVVSAIYQLQLSKIRGRVGWTGCDPWAFMLKYETGRNYITPGWEERVKNVERELKE